MGARRYALLPHCQRGRGARLKDTTAAILQRAEKAIATGERDLGFDNNAVANRAYYAMFYSAIALLDARGLHFRSHKAVHSAFAQTFVRDGPMDAQYHRWLLTAFNLRNRADYSLLDDTTESAAVLTLEQARNFLAATRAYLEQHPA